MIRCICSISRNLRVTEITLG